MPINIRKEMADELGKKAIAMALSKVAENMPDIVGNIAEYGDPEIPSTMARKLQVNLVIDILHGAKGQVNVSAKWKFVQEHDGLDDTEVVDLNQPGLPFKEEGEA